VFLGAGVPIFGPVSPSNKKWYWTGQPAIPHDPAQAKKLLASIGVTGDKPARFTILTQKGRPSFERAISVIRDELAKVGVTVDAAALDGNALVQQIYAGKYDAVYFNFFTTDTDPSLTADFWLSSGAAHFWNPQQKTPATAWEAKIDALFRANTGEADEAARKRTFDEIQAIFAEHLPALYFAAPRSFVVSSARVGNVTPVVLRPQMLWSPDTITVTPR
jgi:peptide/nickel transport system substrate-binding protein